MKKVAFNFMKNYRDKEIENFDKEGSVFSQIPRFYGDDSKEFNIYFPDLNY